MPLLALLARPMVIVSLLLAASLAGNYGLYKLWLGEVKHAGAISAEKDQAMASAEACSANTKRLVAEAADRERRMRAAVIAAEKRAREAAVAAAGTLLERPSTPGDLCKSADDLIVKKLSDRRHR